ncbi:MAG: hypothetical protein IPH77_20790 [Ignavibacteria bacterium]|nr:hypothetical protein [Ignavibacteria bacterium]
MISYSDNYLNSGDWDQWIYSSQDASAWTSTVIEFSGSYKSHSGDIAAKETLMEVLILHSKCTSCRDMIASAEIRTNSIQSYVPVVNDNFAGSLPIPSRLSNVWTMTAHLLSGVIIMFSMRQEEAMRSRCK